MDCSAKEMQEIPEFHVSRITTSNVSFDNISVDVPPNSLVRENRLEFIDLNNNKIKGVVESDFQGLPKLMHLFLDYNLITVIDPHAFERNTKLQKLTLNGNELAFTKSTQPLIVPSLGKIELENCSISDLPINFFNNMSNLVSIRLGNNKIEQLDSGLFSHLRKLRHLHLQGNQIKQLVPDIFKTNHKLHRLYLRGNPLDNFNGSHFLDASSLISLDISSCNITNIPNKFFSNLHNLVSLDLNDNRLQSFNLNALPQNLEVLDISGNSLTNVTVTTGMIRLLDSLKHLHLTNNNFDCNCRSLALWKWCEKLKPENGGATSCEEFCPTRCLEQEEPSGGKPPIGNVHFRRNTNTKVTTMEPEKSDGEEYSDVENVDDPHVVSGKDANDTFGELRVNDESGREGLDKTWNIIMYSVIGVFGGLVLIGSIALLTDAALGCRKPRYRKPTRSSSIHSLRNLRLELMDPKDDRQETTPLSLHHGFEFVPRPTNAHRNSQPIQVHRS